MATTPPQAEKPFHYKYLKEFRVNQCPLFLQHKCTQHRPFTCFHWHFSNQRRRRPLRKRDGTFNYSADVYCSKYDETTGICPDGDDCLFIHRNTGDTERRYHLRYYKTGTCIHETDSRGNCVKNGPHCAFAHGAHDLRPPVYDVREQQNQDNTVATSTTVTTEQQKQEMINLTEKIVNEDPKWQDANYVLANYKTELCKRPPRLCRQGYACPQYHNTKDRRRNPKKFKYRSSPCPTVKHGDDWKDPTCCEKGDSCQFCHTRTEQQFHPEIYKSTKCHDMTQTGYCPRGPFCAFAHVEQEIRVVENAAPSSPGLIVGSFNQLNTDGSTGNVTELVENKISSGKISSSTAEATQSELNASVTSNSVWNNFSNSFNQEVIDPVASSAKSFTVDNRMSKSLPHGPFLSKPLDELKAAIKDFSTNFSLASYSKAPGSERATVNDQASSMSIQDFSSLGNTSSWPMSINHGANVIGSFSSTSSSPSNLLPRSSNLLNSDAPPFYPPDETVDSVVGNALKDFDEPKLPERTSENLLSSQIWNSPKPTGHDPNISSSLFPMSDPVNIPQEQVLHQNVSRGLSGGLSSMSPPLLDNVEFPSSASMPGGRYVPMPQSSPLIGSSGQSGLSSSFGSGMINVIELERMQQKCKQWEDSWNQAKAACDAWKREATDANERARLSEDRGRLAVERCQFLENKLTSVDASGDAEKNCPFLHQPYDFNDLRKLSVSSLKQLQAKYKNDLESVEKLIWEMLWKPQQKH